MCISSGRTTFDGARQSGHATETPLRRLIDRATSAVANESEHDAHIAWRKAKKAKKTNDNKKKSNPTTAAALSAVGSSIIPEKAQSLLDNDNKDTLDLSAKNGKTELIEELKARNADSYPKVQSGPNQGNPTGAVNIPMLTSLLKAANDDRNIVVRKAAGASAPAVPEWRRWRIATSRCLGGWFKFEV